jgi:hypothetical protein
VVGGGGEESFGVVAKTKFGCSLGDYGLLAWRLERGSRERMEKRTSDKSCVG